MPHSDRRPKTSGRKLKLQFLSKHLSTFSHSGFMFVSFRAVITTWLASNALINIINHSECNLTTHAMITLYRSNGYFLQRHETSDDDFYMLF